MDGLFSLGQLVPETPSIGVSKQVEERSPGLGPGCVPLEDEK